ncbi:hydroxymethylglutaryl-CoA synthase [Streptococcus merionis]|uniref:3-hydroxy-3-methylglutaryl CoA synthase n=1 Tax=Streptococcus merionis TaxID=400065 RepID=A0A239SRW1_9STRE|nr:hydroxymethylglutaryl-CoA synthase [Streptococcus merionis]SNU88096.1 3-hydroxy-3-methylglutaryl CoA synthase [Streptococcus merionis]
MTKIGIDKIGLALPNYVLDLKDLAAARGIDPNKYTIGLMQEAMAITPVTQDIVTLGAQAAAQILTEEDKATIDMVIVGTETGIDQSKATAVYIHGLLGIQPFARAIELKEACYSAAAGLEFARNHIANRPEAKVLVIASDIAKYGLNSGGEPTQGAGAVAMLVSANPRILELNWDNVYQTRDVMDFWRPNYSPYPKVDGRFSTEQYTDCLQTTFEHYRLQSGKELDDFAAVCLHIPFAKQGLKGLRALQPSPKHEERFFEAIRYNQQVGNIYTGSLFLSLLSLLEQSKALKAGDDILLYSYGSGAVCELFSARLVSGYRDQLMTDRFEQMSKRQRLSMEQYEELFFETIPIDEMGNSPELPEDNSPFVLTKIENHQRIYHKH